MDRENLRRVLGDFGITGARRALVSNETEEVILLSDDDYSRIDIDAFSRAVAAVFQDKKVAAVPQNERWRSEPI